MYLDESSESQISSSVEEQERECKRLIFNAIEKSDLSPICELLSTADPQSNILVALITFVYPNSNGIYDFDEGLEIEAREFFGPRFSLILLFHTSNLFSTRNLNILQVLCFNQDEETALKILDFVNNEVEELESKFILYEFMGMTWGAGNTTLHLASFFGMSELVTRLLQLGAAAKKKNSRKYRAVDCAGDEEMRKVFGEFDAKLEQDGTVAEDLSATFATMNIRNKSELPKLQTDIGLSSNSQPMSDLPYSPGLKKKTGQKVRFDISSQLMSLCKFGAEASLDYMNDIKTLLGIEREDTPPGSINDNVSNAIIDVNSISTPHKQFSLLQLACTYGHDKLVDLLLSKTPIKVNTRDIDGWTPLHSACAEGYVEIIRLLAKCLERSKTGGRIMDEKGGFLFSPPDGPILLFEKNNDSQTPLDLVSLEDTRNEIESIIRNTANTLGVEFQHISDKQVT